MHLSDDDAYHLAFVSAEKMRHFADCMHCRRVVKNLREKIQHEEAERDRTNKLALETCKHGTEFMFAGEQCDAEDR